MSARNLGGFREKLSCALLLGKSRGHSEVKLIGSKNMFVQYAIRKTEQSFETYFFKVEESKLEMFEEYAEEEAKKFKTFEEALNYPVGKGGEIHKLKAMKGLLIF